MPGWIELSALCLTSDRSFICCLAASAAGPRSTASPSITRDDVVRCGSEMLDTITQCMRSRGSMSVCAWLSRVSKRRPPRKKFLNAYTPIEQNASASDEGAFELYNILKASPPSAMLEREQ